MKVKPDLLLYKIWIVQLILVSLMILSPVIVFIIIGFFGGEAWISVFNIIYTISFAPFLIFTLVWMKYYIKSLEYEITSDNLMLKGGVWWKYVKTIPFKQITDVRMSQGPVQRYWGLGSLSIHTAGHGASSEPEGKLHGLRNYEKVRNEILKSVKRVK